MSRGFRSSELIWTLLWAITLVAANSAHAVEQGLPLDVAAPGQPGTLVICGGGDVPDSVMLHFIELAGGPEARIVFIPTAALGADHDEMDEDLEFFRRQQLGSLTVFHTRCREKANDREFSKPLSEATGVWLGGGCQSLLTDVYLGTTAEELIRYVLDRGGVVGGISAGAAVMSPVMIRGGELEPEVGRGFGLLPGTVIDQHFLKRNRQDRLMRVLTAHPGLVGIGIDEGTALIVRGHRLTVMGDSDVVTCLSAGSDCPAQVERLSPGDEADLRALILAATSRTRPALAAVVETESVISTTEIVPPVTEPATPRSSSATATEKPVATSLVWDPRSGRFVRAAGAPPPAPPVKAFVKRVPAPSASSYRPANAATKARKPEYRPARPAVPRKPASRSLRSVASRPLPPTPSRPLAHSTAARPTAVLAR
jgi:cyanophycinase